MPEPQIIPKKGKRANKRQIVSSESENNENYLDGLTIVVTGSFQKISRPDLVNFIKAHGAKNTTAISRKTDYLIAGHILDDGR